MNTEALSEKKRLTNDNSALYEKIRYLQNYSQSSSKPSQRYSGHIDSVESGKPNPHFEFIVQLCQTNYHIHVYFKNI